MHHPPIRIHRLGARGRLGAKIQFGIHIVFDEGNLVALQQGHQLAPPLQRLQSLRAARECAARESPVAHARVAAPESPGEKRRHQRALDHGVQRLAEHAHLLRAVAAVLQVGVVTGARIDGGVGRHRGRGWRGAAGDGKARGHAQGQRGGGPAGSCRERSAGGALHVAGSSQSVAGRMRRAL